jgi:hypothetical protein
MPLYVVTFTEYSGSRRQCRLMAAAQADPIALAVQKIWGAHCYWTWVPGSDTEGRVYECVGAEPSPDDFPRTGRTTVQLIPAQRRPRVS